MCQKIKSLSAMVLSAEENIKIVQVWYETRSFVSVKCSFRREHGCNPSETQHNNAISRIVHHFEKERTVHGKNQGRSGRSGLCDVIWGSEVKTSDLVAHFSRKSGAANTVLFTIQMFNEHSRIAKLSEPYLRGHMR